MSIESSSLKLTKVIPPSLMLYIKMLINNANYCYGSNGQSQGPPVPRNTRTVASIDQ